MEKCENEDRISTFWKKRSMPVPGRPIWKNEIRSSPQLIPSTRTSFQYFQESVSDAWEAEDEDLCNISDKKSSEKTVYFTTVSVINSQSKILQPQVSETNSSSQKQQNYINNSHNQGEDSVMIHSSRKCSNETPSSHIKREVAIKTDDENVLSKVSKFKLLLESNPLDLEQLRHLSWSGVPGEVRHVAWRLLAGYLPASLERRQVTMERKRLDYWNLVKQYFDTKSDETFQETYRQIHIDIPRMSPLIALFKQKTVQEMFERILFIWAIRHPASGYVQGINDLVTPFFVVFLQEFLPVDTSIDVFQVETLPKEHQDIVEADSFWCLSKFLDGIQDNYVFAQVGIQRNINQLKELIRRVDNTLHQHLVAQGVDYLQFSFRWMNNLLMREIPLQCSVRLWDTYLAEADSFSSFHLYVCAAFLLHWREELLREQDFQGVMLLLQKLPTHDWTEAEIGVLVAEAYRLKFTFADAPNHLRSNECS